MLYGAGSQVENAHFPDEKHDYGISKRMAAYPFLARRLNLSLDAVMNSDGNIDESFVKIEDYETMLVFSKTIPYPEDAVSPNSKLP